MAGTASSSKDAARARAVALTKLASGVDLVDLVDEVSPLHPKHDTFPGEVFLSLAADAIDEGRFSREQPLDYEGLRERLLPEVKLRGRNDQHKSFYTLVTPPALRGGVAPDLLGEVQWWQADDYWEFALYALIVYVRAAAERLDSSVADVCRSLARRHDIEIN
jgi:hypothetical protein